MQINVCDCSIKLITTYSLISQTNNIYYQVHIMHSIRVRTKSTGQSLPTGRFTSNFVLISLSLLFGLKLRTATTFLCIRTSSVSRTFLHKNVVTVFSKFYGLNYGSIMICQNPTCWYPQTSHSFFFVTNLRSWTLLLPYKTSYLSYKHRIPSQLYSHSIYITPLIVFSVLNER